MFLSESRKKQGGFTLIELMIAVVMVAILASLAVPSFNRTISDNRVLSETNTLIAAAASARTEAMKRGRMVSICASSDGLTCGANWSDGWMVYVENAAVTVGGVPIVDTVLLTGETAEALQVNQTAGNPWIRFTSRGLVSLAPAEPSVTLEVSPQTCTSSYNYNVLTFGVTGRPSKTPQTCP